MDKKILISAAVVWSLFPLSVFAGAHEDGWKSFQALDELRATAIEPIDFKHQAVLASLREELRLLETEKDACTTFECAQESNVKIRAARKQIADTDIARREEIIRAELPFEKRAREIALDSAAALFLEKIAADDRFSHLRNRGVSACAPLIHDRTAYHPLSAPHVCVQLNLDYKYRGRFIRASVAIGTALKHFTWENQFAPVRSSLGLSEVAGFFKDKDLFLGTAGPEGWKTGFEHARSFFNTQQYMLGGNSYLGVAITSYSEE